MKSVIVGPQTRTAEYIFLMSARETLQELRYASSAKNWTKVENYGKKKKTVTLCLFALLYNDRLIDKRIGMKKMVFGWYDQQER